MSQTKLRHITVYICTQIDSSAQMKIRYLGLIKCFESCFTGVSVHQSLSPCFFFFFSTDDILSCNVVFWDIWGPSCFYTTKEMWPNTSQTTCKWFDWSVHSPSQWLFILLLNTIHLWSNRPRHIWISCVKKATDTVMSLTAELLQVVSLLFDCLSSMSQQRLHLVRQQSMKLQFQRVDLNNL